MGWIDGRTMGTGFVLCLELCVIDEEETKRGRVKGLAYFVGKDKVGKRRVVYVMLVIG